MAGDLTARTLKARNDELKAAARHDATTIAGLQALVAQQQEQLRQGGVTIAALRANNDLLERQIDLRPLKKEEVGICGDIIDGPFEGGNQVGPCDLPSGHTGWHSCEQTEPVRQTQSMWYGAGRVSWRRKDLTHVR